MKMFNTLSPSFFSEITETGEIEISILTCIKPKLFPKTTYQNFWDDPLLTELPKMEVTFFRFVRAREWKHMIFNSNMPVSV